MRYLPLATPAPETLLGEIRATPGQRRPNRPSPVAHQQLTT